MTARRMALGLALAATSCAGAEWEHLQASRAAAYRACLTDTRASCDSAGHWLLAELRVDDARTAFQRGCERGDAVDCAHAHDLGVPGAIERACELERPYCITAALATPVDDPQRDARIDRACAAADAACQSALEQLQGVGDPAGARAARRACATPTDRDRCALVAALAWSDPDLRRELRTAACQAGAPDACWWLARTQLTAAGPAARAGAADLAQRACAHGVADACDPAAARARRDADRAACRRGDTAACEAVGVATAGDE